MQTDPLTPVWERLDCEPPLFSSEDLDRELGESRDRVVNLGFLRETSGARSALCSECSNGHVGIIQSLAGHRTGQVQSYIVCPECGPVPIHTDRLRRWEVHIPHLLKAVMHAARGRHTHVELIAGHLWHMGNATWSGRRREVYFGRCVHDGNRDAVVAAIATRPIALLLFPTEVAALAWTYTRNPVIARESVVSLGPNGIVFDSSLVESRLTEDGLTGRPAKKPLPKRATRSEKIARLTAEMIQHLRDAREHALGTRDLTGTPDLRLRPTMQQLAKLTGLSKSDVTRCFQDKSARELNLFWEIALDLDQVMVFRRPGGGRPAG